MTVEFRSVPNQSEVALRDSQDSLRVAPARASGRVSDGAAAPDPGTSAPAPAAFRRGPLSWARAMLGGCVLVCGIVACAGSQGDAKGPDHRIKMDTRIVHEPCDVNRGSIERHDLNGDGKPELTIVKLNGREHCRIADLNLDGAPDAWAYRWPDGSIRRRESDFDRDGRVDEIASYKGGTLVSKQLATSMRGELDTWQFYGAGRLQKTQRDANGDTYLDQWWEYPDPTKPECPLVHSDVDGDGRPDPGATVNVCASDDTATDKTVERSALDLGGMETPTESEGAAVNDAATVGPPPPAAPAVDSAPTKPAASQPKPGTSQ
jgi:hypothetical protein